jgi:hypothetical protein
VTGRRRRRPMARQLIRAGLPPDEGGNYDAPTPGFRVACQLALAANADCPSSPGAGPGGRRVGGDQTKRRLRRAVLPVGAPSLAPAARPSFHSPTRHAPTWRERRSRPM